MITTMTIEQAQGEVVNEFALMSDWQDKYEHLIGLGRELPLIAPEHKVEVNLVRGCQARVWLHTELKDGRIHFEGNASELRESAARDPYMQSFLS